MGFSLVHFTLPESKTIVGYKTHRLLSIAHTYRFSSVPGKRFLPLLPLIHMYQIACSKNAHQTSYYLYFYNREREAMKAYSVDWHILVYRVHTWQFPKGRKISKYQKYRTTRTGWVLMRYCKRQERTFHCRFWKLRIESNLSVVAFTFEPPSYHT